MGAKQSVVTMVVLFVYSSSSYGFKPAAIKWTGSTATTLSMVSTDARPDLVKVTNAFDSPSIIKFNKEVKDGATNPFNSPSVRVNGGGTSNAINPADSPSVMMLNRAGTESVDAMKSPAVTFLGIKADAVANAMTSPSLQITSESKTKLDMPLSLVIGQELIKTGLILCAVNPNIGGIVIAGGKGTAKSVMARALHRVMPPIEIVKGSEYNIAPDATTTGIDDFLRKKLETEGKTISELETEVVTCPFVQVSSCTSIHTEKTQYNIHSNTHSNTSILYTSRNMVPMFYMIFYQHFLHSSTYPLNTPPPSRPPSRHPPSQYIFSSHPLNFPSQHTLTMPPSMQVPVNVMEDRLFGSVDVKKTLETGETVFTPGLMASSHRGILYVDDINLVDDDLVTMMLQAVTDGFVIVEREGISVKYPCKPILIATLNPEDSELKDVFLDRIGISLNADTEPLSMEVRILSFINHSPSIIHPRNYPGIATQTILNPLPIILSHFLPLFLALAPPPSH